MMFHSMKASARLWVGDATAGGQICDATRIHDMLQRRVPGLLILCLAATGPATAQTDSAAAPRPIESAGVFRASALVDSVFVDRQLPRATVDGGDFTAYLMARLGVRDLPAQLGFTVTVDTSFIRIGGRIGDLPGEARQA